MSQSTMANTGFLSGMRQSFGRLFNRAPIAIGTTDQAEPGQPAEKPVVKLDTATGLMVERYYVRGKLHRDEDKPAVVEYDPANNRVVREQYFQHGKLNRDGDKPAFIEYSPSTGKVVLEVFFEDGRLRRGDNTPSAIDYDRVTGEPIQYDLRRPGSPPLKKS